jgi:hypothetical protein
LKDDHWYNDYSQNAQLAELIGIATAQKNQQTYMNGLLEALVAKLSEIQMTLTSLAAGTATQWSPTIPQRHIEEDGSNALGSEL